MVSNSGLFLYDVSGEVSINFLYSRSPGVDKKLLGFFLSF